MASPMRADGRLLQVNVSAGGVPKLPVEQAWVGRLGVEGDEHRERTVHGGPHRAVCLFGIEAIERLQAEGHPVEAGSVGENLTTSGIEWSTLPVGTRARIGERLLIEIASSTTPCDTQRPNFLGGRISRINIALHPSDSRMYARVLEEGRVRPGDAIELLQPALDSRAAIEALLDRIERPEQASSLRLWAAARAAGYDVRVLDDGDICAASSSELPEPAFNHAQGLRQMPQLLPEILAHFRTTGTPALVPHVAPTPNAAPREWMAVHAATPAQLTSDAAPAGVTVVAPGGSDEQAAWIDVFVSEMADATARAWRALLPNMLDERNVRPFLALVDGRAAGVGVLQLKRGVALLRGGRVVPALRGRGVQRALIAARARAAVDELGCELVASIAQVGSVSSRNLALMGLRRIDSHPVYEYVPG